MAGETIYTTEDGVASVRLRADGLAPDAEDVQALEQIERQLEGTEQDGENESLK